MNQEQEARFIRLTGLLRSERGQGYARAFYGAIHALTMFATWEAGIRGMTKATASALRNTVGQMIGHAETAAREHAIPYPLYEQLRDHAQQAVDDTEKRLGMRGGK